ncbi:MAG TPA: hypothetical protein DCO73_06615 [Alphaproteobacteria bacterium]|nr:hypothetical protein [Alphaproteobacteria bacterium]
MLKLVYSADELMASHPFAQFHEAAGHKLHGGFDNDGAYTPPRSLHRWPAIHAWQAEVERKGLPLIDCSPDLLKMGNYPSTDQQRFLLRNGFAQTLWNSLTIAGIIEGRGKLLADFPAPNFQEIIVEDISEMCLGHLNKGLLVAHGWDEGGNPATDIGAHDEMWFAVRDALFGEGAYPLPEPPERIGRPEQGRLMPQIPQAHEEYLLLLMNLTMIEVRAEATFRFYESVVNATDTFADNPEGVQLAAELIDRIRQDENIHVASLRVMLSEFRGLTIKTNDGGTMAGKDLFDPIWAPMIEWHVTTAFQASREQTRDTLREQILAAPDGEKLFAEFEALEQRQMAAE